MAGGIRKHRQTLLYPRRFTFALHQNCCRNCILRTSSALILLPPICTHRDSASPVSAGEQKHLPAQSSLLPARLEGFWLPACFLPEKSYGRRGLVGYSLWGHKESDTTERLSTHTHTHTDTWGLGSILHTWQQPPFEAEVGDAYTDLQREQNLVQTEGMGAGAAGGAGLGVGSLRPYMALRTLPSLPAPPALPRGARSNLNLGALAWGNWTLPSSPLLAHLPLGCRSRPDRCAWWWELAPHGAQAF